MKILSIFVIVFSLFLSGCVTSYSPSTNVVDLDNIDFADVEMMKRGKSCSSYILFMGPLGSNRLFDATKDARIKKVKYVEKSFSAFPLVFLPIFSRSCIIAYGE